MRLKVLLLMLCLSNPILAEVSGFSESAKNTFVQGCIRSLLKKDDNFQASTLFCACAYESVSQIFTEQEFQSRQKQAGKSGAEDSKDIKLKQAWKHCEDNLPQMLKEVRPIAVASKFMLPIPEGFFEPKTMGGLIPLEEIRSMGGLVLAESKRPNFDKGFMSSIIVIPVDTKTSGADVSEATCRALAGGTQGKIVSIQVIGEHDSKRCLIKKQDEKVANRGATQTLFKAEDSLFSLTCNYDTRDTLAIHGCDSVMQGWQSLSK